MQAYHLPLEYFVWEISYANLVLLQLDSTSVIYKDSKGNLPNGGSSGNLSDVISTLQKSQEASAKEKEAQEVIAAALARKRQKQSSNE